MTIDPDHMLEVLRGALTGVVIAQVVDETEAAFDKFGGQWSLLDGTDTDFTPTADLARARTNAAAQEGTLTWRHVLDEEVAEALAEVDPGALAAELVQVAAVAIRWATAIAAREVVDVVTVQGASA